MSIARDKRWKKTKPAKWKKKKKSKYYCKLKEPSTDNKRWTIKDVATIIDSNGLFGFSPPIFRGSSALR